MYYATGLPGWMRFGFSPGWVGRSPTGLGPCATYLTTGQWPAPLGQWNMPNPPPIQTPFEQGNIPPGAPAGPWAAFNPLASVPKEQQVSMLEEQANLLESQLKEITERIKELKSEAQG